MCVAALSSVREMSKVLLIWAEAAMVVTHLQSVVVGEGVSVQDC